MSYHHPKTTEAYHVLANYWKEKTAETTEIINYTHATSHHRCDKCWLRRHQCYCEIASTKIKHYKNIFSENISNCSIIIYYHYQEIGRSANTAHVFELLCPHICTKLLYGDIENETNLFNDMRKEYECGILRTCVLYPSSDAVNIQDWVDMHTNHNVSSDSDNNDNSSNDNINNNSTGGANNNSNNSSGGDNNNSNNNSSDNDRNTTSRSQSIEYYMKKKFRIIALDGTYRQVCMLYI